MQHPPDEDRGMTPIICKAHHQVILTPDQEPKILHIGQIHLSEGQINQLASHLISCKSMRDSALQGNTHLSKTDSIKFVANQLTERESEFNHFFQV